MGMFKDHLTDIGFLNEALNAKGSLTYVSGDMTVRLTDSNKVVPITKVKVGDRVECVYAESPYMYRTPGVVTKIYTAEKNVVRLTLKRGGLKFLDVSDDSLVVQDMSFSTAKPQDAKSILSDPNGKVVKVAGAEELGTVKVYALEIERPQDDGEEMLKVPLLLDLDDKRNSAYVPIKTK